jgi:CHAT domain-containing protein/tetratricopeptide (TPR) repeat protein
MTCLGLPNTKRTIRSCLLLALLLLFFNVCADYTKANDAVSNAAAVFSEAARLRAEQSKDSNLTAVARYREAAELWRAGKNFNDAAVALRNAGELLQLLGDTAAARDAYNEALLLTKKTRNQLEEAHVRNDLAYSYFLAGETNKARQNCQAALKIARTLHDRATEAEALSNLGETFFTFGDLAKAQDYQQQSLAIWRELNNQHGQAIALIALGYYYVNLGEPAKALDSYNQGLSLARSAKDLAVETLALSAIGNIKRKLGERQEALTSYYSAKLLAERIGDRTSQASVTGGIGGVSMEMGDYRTSLEYLEKAIELFEANGQKWGVAEGLIDRGRINHALGNEQKALDTFNEALALVRSLSMRRLESITLRSIGLVYSGRGDTQHALKAFQQSLRLLNQANDQRLAAYTLNCIGKAYEGLNRSDLAAGYYQKALVFAQRSADPESETLSLYNLANLECRRGNLRQAGSHIEAAVNIAETVRTNVASQDLRTSYFAMVHDSYDLYIHILMSQHKHDPAAGFDREAFAVSEKARARSLLEGINPLPQTLNLIQTQERVLDDETTLVEFALGKERSYAWVVTRDDASSFELSSRAEIEEAAKRLYEVITSLQLVSGETVEARAERERRAEETMPAEIAALSELLLAPLAAKLKTKRLLIVADGALQYIPFQILLDSDSQQPLIARHEIVNQPSASTLAVLLSEISGRKPAANLIAVLADPVFEINDPRVKQNGPTPVHQPGDLLAVRRALRDVGVTPDGLQVPRLFASGREANEIIALAPARTTLKAVGFAANRDRVVSPELASYRIVHIATHGIVNSERPELSGIVLSLLDQEGHSQDGFLRLQDIYHLKLPADLVVLSACSTALGKDVKGEGLVGLTRGFMYAGAAGVVASLWKVDDEATAELMKHFYAALFQKGMSPAAALRDGQLQLARQARWQSPYYWAGFVIQGQYDQQSFVSSSTGMTQLVFVAVLGGALFLAAILFVIRRQRARGNE